MWVPRNIVVIKRPSLDESMRDYTMIAKDSRGRVMFKYVMVVFARGSRTKSTMRVMYSRSIKHIVPGSTRTVQMNATVEGTPAAFMLKVLKELRQWEENYR